jgi:hypothetical protein
MEQCRRAAVQRSMKDLSFCKKIPLPGYYESKKYGLRKAKTYKGKPHKTHVRVIRDKHKGKSGVKCKCYICGEEGHYAKECRRKRGDLERVHYVDNLLIAENWDIVSVDQSEPDSEGIQSISDGDHRDELEANPYEEAVRGRTDTVFVLIQGEIPQAQLSWMPQRPLTEKQQDCMHEWEEKAELAMGNRLCTHCGKATDCQKRIWCDKCLSPCVPSLL